MDTRVHTINQLTLTGLSTSDNDKLYHVNKIASFLAMTMSAVRHCESPQWASHRKKDNDEKNVIASLRSNLFLHYKERSNLFLHEFIRIILLALVLLFANCTKDDVYTSDPRTNFDALWKIIDEHYCFFEYKQVDWDEVYRKYSVMVSDTLNQYALFGLLGDMLAELKDGHTNLISSFDVARYWSWYEDYPSNFNEDIHKSYLGTDYRIAGGIKYRMLSNDQIGYMYYGSFSSGVGENNLDHIFNYFKDCKGLIIDVRENGGGSLTYSDRIASRFLTEKIVTGYIRHKTGPGHNDFSKLYPIELSPSKRIRWLRPVVVLTNRHSYSATNDFVSKMKMLPQVVIMGDRTGGGSGLPFNSELPIGWLVRFSASPMLDANKQDTEHGIDPDIKVSMTAADMVIGKDTLIESAISYINENTAAADL